jgi:hypothetical protein
LGACDLLFRDAIRRAIRRQNTNALNAFCHAADPRSENQAGTAQD